MKLDKNILFVDSNKANISALKRIAHFIKSLQTANTIDEAYKQVLHSSIQYDVILAKGILQDGNGFDLVQKVRSITKEDTPFVFLIDDTNANLVFQLCTYNNIAYLKQPYDIMAIFSSIQHISQSKDSQSIRNYQAILHHLLDKHAIVAEVDTKMMFTHINEAFMNISGYTKKELIGKSHEIIEHPDMPEDAYKYIWEAIGKKKSWRGIIKNITKNGDYYLEDCVILPKLDNQGKIIGYKSIGIDITQQEKATFLLSDILEDNSIEFFVEEDDDIVTIKEHQNFML